MNKKGKIVMTITIGIACFILIMIIFMQFKVVQETDATSIETMREEDLKTELANWKQKYEEVEQRYQEVQETLNKYKEETTSDKEAKENLQEELENLNLILGVTDVEGQGIVITLNETDKSTENINADDLMIIVNYLKDAGAEAISINEQRIVNLTDFAYVNSSFIKINSQRIVSPYVIKVIGNPDYLKSALLGTGGYAKELEAVGHEFTIDTPRKVEIPKYTGDMSVKYLEDSK